MILELSSGPVHMKHIKMTVGKKSKFPRTFMILDYMPFK